MHLFNDMISTLLFQGRTQKLSTEYYLRYGKKLRRKFNKKINNNNDIDKVK